MGLFRSICNLFRSSRINDTSGSDDSSSFSAPDDYGINPSTGLPMISGAIDAGGFMYGEQPTTFDSADSASDSLFEDESSFISTFDDSNSCASPFDSEIGSSYSCGMSDSFDSTSSMFDTVSSSSMFDD